MVAIKTSKKFKKKDITVMAVLVGLWLALNFALASVNPQYSYIISLLILTILMTFAVLIINKSGVATIFYLLAAITTYSFDSLGALGINKIIVLGIAGLSFELVFLVLKLEFKSTQLGILFGSALSSAIIPLAMAFLISFDVASNLIVLLINMILLSFFVGIIGAVISFLIWYNISTTKWALRPK